MGKSLPRTIFGIHEVTLVSRATGLPYGSFEVLGGSTFEMTGELIKLSGGSSKFIWDVADGKIESSVKLKAKEYPNFAMQLFLGKTPTVNAAEASGYASSLTNKVGTSVMNATTGIAGVGVKSGKESDLKFTKFAVKVKTATTVSIYGLMSVDYGRGTVKDYLDDGLLIMDDVTITASTATEITGFGVELTGGSGVIGMTVDDVAVFETRPVNTGSTSVSIGSRTDVFEEFEMILSAEKKGGKMFNILIYRAKGIGMPFGMEEKAFGEYEQSIEVMYDRTKDAIALIEEVVA